jgi:hypothetical protein
VQRLRAVGETGEIRFDVEPDHEAPVGGKELSDMRPEVNPATVAARHDDGTGVGHAVEMD